MSGDSLVPNAVTISDKGRARYVLKHVAENYPSATDSPVALIAKAQAVGIEPPSGVDDDLWRECAAEVVDECT